MKFSKSLEIAFAAFVTMLLMSAAHADPATIYVGGVQLNAGESATCEGGVVTKSAVYSTDDPIRHDKDGSNWSVLSLSNAVISSAGDQEAAIVVYKDYADHWTLRVTGDCKINSPARFGILCDIGLTYIKGDGKLEVTAADQESRESAAIKVHTPGGSALYGSLGISESVEVTARGAQASYSRGIYTEYSCNVGDTAKLHAIGGTSASVSCGIYAYGANSTWEKNTTVTLEGGEAGMYSYGFISNRAQPNIKGTNVTMTGKTAAFSIGSYTEGTGSPILDTENGVNGYVTLNEDGSGTFAHYTSIKDSEGNWYKYFTTVPKTITHSVVFQVDEYYNNAKLLGGAHVQILNGNDVAAEFTSVTGRTATVSGLLEDTPYIVYVDVPTPGYYSRKYETLSIGSDGSIAYSGKKTDSGVLRIPLETTQVFVESREEDKTTVLAGAHIQIVDPDGKVVDEWDSTTSTHETDFLVAGITYKVHVSRPAPGHGAPADATIRIGMNGTINYSGTIHSFTLLVISPILTVEVSFDGNGGTGVWRSIAQGSTMADPADPTAVIDGGAAHPEDVYVWTADTNIAEVVAGGRIEEVRRYEFCDGVTRIVGTLHVRAGDESVPFLIKATGAVGETTQVVLAPTPTNILDAAGNVITNYVERTIEVAPPCAPGAWPVGSEGWNVTASLDDDGVFTLSGSGRTRNFASASGRRWDSFV